VTGGASGDILDVLAIEHAIVQAPVGACATPQLVAAVGEAGGLGTLACTWTPPADLAPLIDRVRALTRRPFAANLVLWFDVDAQLDALLGLRVPVVTFSWGQPGRERIARCRAAGTRVAVQVGSADGARQARADGADVLIAQGVEAGGHVQSTTPLRELLPAVLGAAGSVPVVAAGGLASAPDVARVRRAGAGGAMLGTRFLATAESGAHDAYKRALLAAGTGDTALTVCFDGDWPQAAHRVLRNATLERWERAGCPGPGRRPDESDALAMRGGRPIARYSDSPPLAGDEGTIGEMCLYAGEGCAAIDDLPAVAELLDRLSGRGSGSG
jgi:NAD(P)H-dependent flavin oxidoreductase YrpB (nitropropane dioxygenase family)